MPKTGKRRARKLKQVGKQRREEPVKADEDTENGEKRRDGRAPRKKKAKLSVSMANLATSDPEFYQYLRDNDHELLEFDESSEDEEMDHDSGASSEEGEGEAGEEGEGEEGEIESVPAHITSWRQREQSGDEESGESSEEEEGEEEEEERGSGILVTVAMVKDWVDTITKDHSLSGVKQLSLALRAAVSGVREEEEEEEEQRGYRVTGTAEFNAVVMACLSHVLPCLHHHIPPSGRSSKKPFLPSGHKHWNRVRPVVQPYCLVLLRLLRGLHEPSMLCAVLRHIRSLASYYTSVPKLHRLLSRQLLTLWEGEDQHVQVLSFVILREITLLTPHPSLHTTLKKIYLTFVRNAKYTSLSSLPRISFMKNCIVEMISLDVATGYQHGFVYIRQLALHLRAAVTAGKRETLQVVRSWQFVHCLDVWCQALSSLLPSPSLQPLLYPLVEVAMGTLTLQASPRMVPLRLHIIATLSRLMVTTGTFIPLAPFLLEIMEAHSRHLAPGSQSAKPPELSCLLRASSTQLHSRGYQTAILTRTFELLLQLQASQSHLIGFPELAYPTVVRLRKIMKTTHISWFRQQLKQLVEKTEEVSTDVTKARSRVTFAPKDTDEIGVWESGRREGSDNVLNRFLTTWEKLHVHAVSEATPTNQQQKVVVTSKGSAPVIKTQTSDERDGDDIVDDFTFSSDSESLSD